MYFPSQPLVDGLDAVHGLYGRVKRAQLSNPSLVGEGMQPLLLIGVSTLTGLGSDHVPHMTTDLCMLYNINVPFSLHENVICLAQSSCELAHTSTFIITITFTSFFHHAPAVMGLTGEMVQAGVLEGKKVWGHFK